jgi:probable rRNA maturation factor
MPISVRSPRSLAGLAPALRSLVRAALRSERRAVGEVGVALADDTLLRALNRDFRGHDKATDVLSFGYDASGELAMPEDLAAEAPVTRGVGREPVNGDLVISMDRVRVQAKRYRVSEGEELARLVVHGALHLAGLDHQRLAERRAMRAREDAVLAASAAPVRTLAHGLRSNGRARTRRRARARA